jgi:hypothetical protein
VLDQPSLEVSSGAGTIDFYYSQDGNNWNTISTEEGGAGSATITWQDTPTSGQYEIRAEDDNTNNTITITLDKANPELNSQSPEDGSAISNDNPDIDATIEDSTSNLQNASIDFEGETDQQTGIGSDSVDLSIDNGDYDSLDDGDYSVDYEAYDEAGNQLTGSWSFTVDTSYDGPEDFSFDPSPGVIDVDEEDREIDVTLEEDNDDDTEISGECLVDGDDEDSFTIDTGDGDGDEFTCDIPDDFDGQMFDLGLQFEDQAGNEFTFDSEEFGFDAYSPTVDSFETVMDVSSFGQDFDVEYTVSDDVSDVDTIEYYVDEDPGEGEVDDSQTLDDDSGEFTLDTEGLDEGEHTLYLRAEDEFGKWSSESSFDFNFYPGESPEASMDVVEDLTITSGSTETVEVTLDNTGRILVPGGDLEFSGFAEDSVSYDSFAPGESSSVDFELSPTDEHLGENDITVSASSVNASATISVLVEADTETQDELQASLDEQVAQYENLSSRIESLRSGLSQDRRDRLESDFSELESSIEEAQSAAENGEYYRVDQMISDLSNQVQATEETYSTVRQEQQTDDRNTLIMVGVGIFLALIGVGVGFVMYSDEYEFNVDLGSDSEDEEVSMSDEENSEGLVDKVKSKIEELRGGEEEGSDEPDYEFK